MNNIVTINGVKYEAIDTAAYDESIVYTCRNCDILKERPPQNMMQLPLCMEPENHRIFDTCLRLLMNDIYRVYKKTEQQ